MASPSIPDPLDPGHIEGQNPATPERLPEHTAHVAGAGAGGAAANEEELGGRPAFLFRSGHVLAVSLDQSGANLPKQPEPWRLERYFTLGIRDVGTPGMNPEPIVRGIAARGYYLWRPDDPEAGEGTTQ